MASDPSLAGAAVEETLRLDPPVHFVRRAATGARDLGGVRIAPGTQVLVGLAAANRDPARCPAPDRFDLARPAARHLAFGHGPHFCAGAALARLEAAAVVRELVPLLAERRPAATAERDGSATFRRLRSLRVAADPRQETCSVSSSLSP